MTMTEKQLRRILYGPHECPECGTQAYLGETFCPECNARIHNRNPILRLFITIAAVAIIGAVVWWKLKW